MSLMFLKRKIKNFINYLLSFAGIILSKESSASRWDGFFKLLDTYQVEINTFVNVGFAYGTNHIFKNISPKKIICIDPLPESFVNMKNFKEKYEKKNPGSQVDIFNFALGEMNSKDFISVFENIGGSTFLEQEGQSGSNLVKKIEVQIVPFDSLKFKLIAHLF